MKLETMAGLALFILAIPACAFSETESFTKSFLFNYDTDQSVLRTIAKDLVTTPELNLVSDAWLTTVVDVGKGGTSSIEQNTLFSGGRDAQGMYSGSGSLFSSAAGTSVSNIDSRLFYNGISIVSNPSDDPEASYSVESTGMGMSMASPGTNDYYFGVEAGHNTVTDATFIRVPQWKTEDPKTFSISMIPNSLQADNSMDFGPMDFAQEDLNLNFGVSENQLDFYNYDFSQTIENGQTTFTSRMAFAKKE
jgi:hypothetical protein